MYRQITSEERYTLGALHTQGFSQAAIARCLGKHPSSISRELKRNSARFDGSYRPEIAGERTRGRRSRSRRNRRFTKEELQAVEVLLREKLSPEQASGYLKELGLLRISHETIYGATRRPAVSFGRTCGVHRRRDASAMGATTAVGGLPGRR